MKNTPTNPFRYLAWLAMLLLCIITQQAVCQIEPDTTLNKDLFAKGFYIENLHLFIPWSL